MLIYICAVYGLAYENEILLDTRLYSKYPNGWHKLLSFTLSLANNDWLFLLECGTSFITVRCKFPVTTAASCLCLSSLALIQR